MVFKVVCIPKWHSFLEYLPRASCYEDMKVKNVLALLVHPLIHTQNQKDEPSMQIMILSNNEIA